MLSIPATKAFEIGSGFRGTEVPGSKHNDPFVLRADGALGTSSNWSGGVQGGITNGEDIYFRYFQSREVFPSSNPSLALDSNPLPQYLSLNKQSNTMVRQAASLREAGMTRALCREPFLS